MMGIGNFSKAFILASLVVSSSVLLSYLALAQGTDANVTQPAVPGEATESAEANETLPPADDAISNVSEEIPAAPAENASSEEPAADESPASVVEEVVVPEEFEDAPMEFNLPQADTRKVRETARTIINRDLPDGAASRFSARQPLAWYKFHYDGVDRVLDPLFLTEERDPTWLDVLLEAFGLYKPRSKVLTERIIDDEIAPDQPTDVPVENVEESEASNETAPVEDVVPCPENIANETIPDAFVVENATTNQSDANVTEGANVSVPDVTETIVDVPCLVEAIGNNESAVTNGTLAADAAENATEDAANQTSNVTLEVSEIFENSTTEVVEEATQTNDTEAAPAGNLTDVANVSQEIVGEANVTDATNETNVTLPGINPADDVSLNETNVTSPVVNLTGNETLNQTIDGNVTLNETNVTEPEANATGDAERTPEEVIGEFQEEVEDSEGQYDEELRLALIRAIEDLTPVDIEDVQTSYGEESFEVRIKVRDRIGTTIRIVDLSDSIGTVRFYRNTVDDEGLMFTTRDKVYSKIFLDEGDTIILRGDVNYLPMEFFVQLGLEVVYFKSLPFVVTDLPESGDVTDVSIAQRGAKFDVGFQYPTGRINMLGSIMPSNFDLSDLKTVYKEDSITINGTEYRSVIIGIGPNVTGKVKLYERLEVDAPSLANMLVCHLYNFEDEFCEGEWEDVPDPSDVRLSAFAFVAPVGNETAGRLNVSISFEDTTLSREFFCDGCSDEKVPAESEVGVLVHVENVDENRSYTYTEYVPSDWSVTDSGGGELSQLNESFNAITWSVGDMNGSIFVNYTAVVPNETADGVFFSQIDETVVEPSNVSSYEFNVTPNVTPVKEAFDVGEAPTLVLEFDDLEDFNRTEVLEQIDERIDEEVLGFVNETNVTVENVTEVPSVGEAESQVGNWTAPDESIGVRLLDPSGREVEIDEIVIEKVDDGRFEISLPTERDIRPGVYTVETTFVKDGETFVVESQFAWGLVSMNTKRGIYRPGETAEMIFVVLDSKGRSVCDASIDAFVTSPLNQTVLLSTSDGGIKRNPECGLYDSSYAVGPEGNYSVDVSAVASGINTSFRTSFLSSENISYDIVRSALSKIDPFANPNRFDVDINVSSLVGPGRVTITEYLPESFIVSTDGVTSSSNGTKSITWTRDVVDGSPASVGYTYSVPLEYPQLYALGKVRVSMEGRDDFEEGRNWFVAVDPTPDTKIKTVEFFINTSAGQAMTANAFWNSTFFISLPESSPVVKNAYVEIYGGTTTGGATVIEAYLNDTLMGRDTTIGVTEWYGWTNMFNASNSSQSFDGLYGISDNSVNGFVLSVRCSVACNATSAKAVITYEYDNSTTNTWINTRTIFVNSTPFTHASNVFWNASRGIAPLNVIIQDSNPSVRSAWVEIGTISDGNAVNKLEVFGTNGRSLQYAARGHPTAAGTHLSGATAEASFFRSMFNASNVTHDHMVYNINSSNVPMPFHLASRCFGDDCGGQYAKLFITYTHTAPRSRTMEFFINNSAAQVAADGWWNSTFPVKLPGNGIINVTKAFVEMGARSPSGVAMILEVGMTDVESDQSEILMSYPRTTGRPFVTREAYSFMFLVNGTNHTTLPRGLLYNITDGSTRQFMLSVRCSSACNALTAKTVIDYNFTSEGRGNMIKFLVNSTERSLAAGGDLVGNFTLRLPDTNPSVNRAWFEAYHNPDDGGSETYNFNLNSSPVDGSGVALTTTTGAGTSSSFQPIHLNATSGVASLYDISDSEVHGYNTKSECTVVGCMMKSILAYVVYDYDRTPESITQQVNDTLNLTDSSLMLSEYQRYSVQFIFATESGNHSKSVSLSSVNQITLSADYLRREIVKVFSDILAATDLILREMQLTFADLLSLIEQVSRAASFVRISIETPFLTELSAAALDLQRYFVEQPVVTAVVDFAFSFQRFVYQTLSLSDLSAISLDLQRFFAEAINLTEVSRVSLDVQRYLSESLGFTEIARVSLDLQRYFSEALSVTESNEVVLNLQRYFSETLSLSEVARVALDVQRYFSESLSITGITRVSLDLQRYFAESLDITDFAAAVSSFPRYVSDSFNLTEFASVSLNLQRFFSESLSLTEFTRASLDMQRYFTESLSLTEISQLAVELQLYFSESLSTTEMTKVSLDLQRYFTETLSLNDITRVAMDLQRYFADTLSLSEIGRASLDFQRYATETFNLDELVQSALDLQRYFTESLSLNEITRVSLDLQRYFTETLLLTESIRTALGSLIYFIENINLTAATSPSLDLQRFFTESLNITEITRFSQDAQRYLVESLNLTEFVRASLDIQRYFAETLSLSDVSVSVAEFQRYVTDLLSLTEMSQVSLELQRYFSESLNVAEISAAVSSFQRFVTETPVMSEIVRVALDLQRYFADALSLTEFTRVSLDLQRYFTDALSLTEVTRVSLDLQRYFADALSLAESIKVALGSLVYFNENIILSEISQSSLDLQRYFTETLNLANLSRISLDIQRYFSESLSLTEIVRVSLDIQRYFSESLNLVDFTISITDFQRYVTETISATEISRLSVDLQRYFAEYLSLTDTDTAISNFQRYVTETPVIAAIGNLALDMQRYFTETLGLAEVVDDLFDVQRYLSETLSINEFARVSLDLQRYFIEALNLTEIMRASLDIQKYFTEFLDVAESISLSLDIQRYFSETLSLSEVARVALDLQRYFTDTLSLTEFTRASLDMQRYFTDTLSLTEFTRASLDMQRYFTESLNLSDLVVGVTDFQRYVTDTLNTTEIFRISLDLQRYFSESLSIGDISVAVASFQRYATDSLSLSEIARASLDVQRYLSESLNLTEITRVSLDLQRYFAESLSLGEIARASLDLQRYFTNTINLVELSRISIDMQRFFAENLYISELTRVSLDLQRYFAESLDITEAVDDLFNLQRYLSETLSLNELARSSVDLQIYFTETLSLDELSSVSLDLQRYFADSLGLTEISRVSLDLQRYFTESLDISDLAAAIASFQRTIYDNLALLELSDSGLSLNIQRSFADVISLAESINLSLGSLIYFTENISLTDVARASLDLQRYFTDALSMSEYIDDLFDVQRSLSELIGLSDLSVAVPNFQRYLTETLFTSEFSRTYLDLQRYFAESLSLSELTRVALDLQRAFSVPIDLDDVTRVVLEIQRFFIEPIDLVEFNTVALNLQRYFAEALGLTGTSGVSLDLQRFLSEALSLNEASRPFLDVQFSFSEIVGLSELKSTALDLQRYFAESLRLAEVVRLSLDVRLFVTQLLDLGEASRPYLDLQRAFSESFGLVELSRNALDLQRYFAESLSLTEINRFSMDLRLFVAERLSITEASRAYLDIQRYFTESFGLVELSRNALDLQRFLSESLSIAEITRISLDLQRSFSEAIDLSEVFRFPLNVQRSFAESLSATEFVRASLDLQRYFNESLYVTELTRVALDLQRAFSVPIDLDEASRTILDLRRAFIDTVNFTEFVRVSLDIQRFFADLLTPTVADRAYLDLQRAFSVPIDLVEFEKTVSSLQRFFADSVYLTEATRLALDLRLFISESVGVSDYILAFTEFPRYAVEALNVTDLTRLSLDLRLFIVQSLGLTDYSRPYLDLQRFFSESMSLSDISRLALDVRLSVSEALGVADLTRVSLELQRYFAESLYATESVRTFLGLQVLFSDVLRIADLSVAIANFQVYVSETPVLSDLSRAALDLQRYFSDAIGVADLTFSFAEFPRYVTDSVGLTDATRVALDIRLFIIDYLSLDEITGVSLDLQLYFTDALQLSEISDSLVQLSLAFSELVDVSELQSRLAELTREFAESLSLADSFAILLNVQRFLEDNVGLTDFTGVGKAITIQSTIVIQIRDAATGTFLEFVEEVVENIVDIVTGGGGGGGGGGAVGEPALPEPPAGVAPIKLEKTPIILGALPGETIEFKMPVRNDRLGPAVFTLQISGIPGEWVTVTPFSLEIPSGETEVFDVRIEVPAGNVPGDYLVKVSVTDGEASEESTFFMRVDKSPALRNRPALSRDIEFDTERNLTNIVINVANSKKLYKQIQFIESIDKSIARSTDDMIFGLDNVPRIIERDPVVMYTFNDVRPDQTLRVSYSVRGIVTDMSKLVYWPFEQMMYVEDTEASGFRADEPDELRFTQGFDNEVRVVVKNLEMNHHSLVASLDLPDGWTSSPDTYPADFGPYEQRQVMFKVAVPAGAQAGRHIVTIVYDWDGTVVTKDVVVVIQSVARLTAIWVIIVVTGAGIVGAVFLARRLISRPRMERAQMRRIRDLRDSMAPRQA